MSVPFWYTNPDAWDTCFLGGVALPGVAQVKTALKRKIDKKSGPGDRGGTLADKGQELSDISISLQLWEDFHLSAWETFLAKNLPKKGQKPQALDIAHPQTQLLGIKSVYITDISSLTPGDVGVFEVELSCVEFAPLPGGKKKGTSKKVEADFRRHGEAEPQNQPVTNPLTQPKTNNPALGGPT